MQANPGGEIGPKDVVGRDGLIKNLWRVLETQSAIVVAERRMGKTSIVKKMRHECAPKTLLLYRDVENIQKPLEFVERVYQDIEQHFSTLKKTAGFVRKFFDGMANFEIGGLVKFPEKAAKDWKRILEAAIADLAKHQGDVCVIFAWDEFPLMLQKIAQTTSPQTAMDLLDTLRSLRQSHPRLRMIYTGSVGLHHITSDLKAAGHMNDATNDMRMFEIPELAGGDAADLALQLLDGENLRTQDAPATVAALVEHTNAIAYYIHHVIAQLRASGANASAALVAQVVDEALTGAHDPWHLDHFRERLDSYYGKERLPVILKILDEVASAATPIPFKQIHQCITGSMSPGSSSFIDRILKGDEEALRTLLKLLERDHYLQQESGTGRYAFRFPLICRWWRLDRSLMS